MPDDDPTVLPEGMPVIAAEDSDDETADQAGAEPTDALIAELLALEV